MSKSPKDFFKYCPRCGTSYDPAFVSDNRLDCKKCGFVFYQSPKATAAAIILDENRRILLTRRAVDPAKGKLDLPGGFINWGESPRDAIIREIDEELKITFLPRNIFDVVHTWYEYEGVRYSLANIFFIGSIMGNPVPSDDVESFEWYDLASIPDEYAFPEMKELLESLRIRIGTK